MIHQIHDPVRTEDNLAQELVMVLGDNSARIWRVLKAIGLGNQFISVRHSALEVIARDEAYDVMKVVASSGRPINL